MQENPLEQALRHLREGKERVARQEALVAELLTDGQDTKNAEELLSELEKLVALARRHLMAEEDQARQHSGSTS